MRRLLPCLVLCLLAACAATQLDVNVHSQGAWPGTRAPGAYAFQRLPSQKADDTLQQALETAARPALQRAGFVPAAADQADVLVQLAARKSEAANDLPGAYADPLWMPYGPAFGYYGAWGGRPWGYGWGWGWGGPVAVVYDVFEVSVLILDARSQATLYESRAKSAGTGDMAQTWAALMSAALMDFPYNAVSPRQVVVPLTAPAAVASAPS